MTQSIDFDAVNAAALRNGRSFVQDLIPGGKFRGLQYVVRNPKRDDQNPGSFSINYRSGVWKDFATGEGGGDFISLFAFVRGYSQSDAARELAQRFGVPFLKLNGSAAPKPLNRGFTEVAPKVYPWGENGPPHRDEIRRHVYRRDGVAVYIKIKRTTGGFLSWYRLLVDGKPTGWQAKKPEDYQAAPYVTADLDPFDSELRNDQLFWPEGEKDVDTLNKLNLPAFTFGGTGDGLPSNIDHYLKDRHIIILADNDEPGREHAEKKAAIAHNAGAASVRIVHFLELPSKNDVSDFIARGGTVEQLHERIDAAPIWLPPKDGAGPSADQQNPKSEIQHLISRCAADIPPEKINWLWPGRLARGKHTCIAGEPGTGKSQLSIAIIAAVTTGGEWPCGEGRSPLGNVIILNAEDGAADTIVPRALAAGADLKRIHIVSAVNDDTHRRAFNLQKDIEVLERKITEIGDVVLVIIDPVSSYLGKTDSHKNSEVRSVLEPLSEMAERTGVSILSITHFSKTGSNNTTKALHRFIGSIAFTGTPRFAFAVVEDADDEGRMLFLHAKNNLAAKPQGLAYRLEQCLVGEDIVASRVWWDTQPVTITANEALAAEASGTEAQTERAEAEELLRDFLSDGPRPVTEIEAEAKGAGISWRTVRRAQKALGIKPYRKAESGDGLGKAGRWYWSLQSSANDTKVAKSSYDGHDLDVATIGGSGHLRQNGGLS